MNVNKINMIRLILVVISVFCLGELRATSFSAKGVVDDIQKSVSGNVTDVNGGPLMGVAVLKKGTKVVAQTDFDGNYKINAQDGDVLIFSYVGYDTKKITVKADTTTLDVIMKEDTSNLDEVVVVGFGSKKRANLTGAVDQVGTEYFKARPVPSAGAALQGAIANLNVTMNANPSSTPSFNIRGYNSITGGSPLIVIDGVASDTDDFARMNPDDIASVTVLRDAASAAIYGSLAAFGVILVTTKDAASEKLTVNVTSNTLLQVLGRGPEFIMDPYIVAKVRDKMGVPWYDLYSDEDLEYAKKVSEGKEPAVRLKPGTQDWQYFGSTDWVKETLNRFTTSQQLSANISQRFDKGSYYFSLGSNRNKGVYKHNTDVYQRNNMRFKGSFNFNDWLSIRTNNLLNNSEYHEASSTGGNMMNLIYRAYSTAVKFNPDGTPTYTYAQLIGSMYAGRWNTIRNTFNTINAFDIKLFDNKLKITGEANYKFWAYKRERNMGPTPYYETIGQKRLYGTTNPYAATRNSYEATNIYNLYANYNEVFADKHNVSAVVGYNQQEFSVETTSARRDKLISTGLPTMQLATGERSISHSKSDYALQGYFARLGYTFDDKYTIELNGRYDGSSRFAKDSRWVFNPSVSAGWTVTNEQLLKNTGIFEKLRVDLIKFRGSYGSLGNQRVSNYPYIPTMGTGETSTILSGKKVQMVTSPGIVSDGLTWETVKTINAGFDAAFLNNRINVNFDYYHRYTLNMLTAGKQLPEVLGTDEPLANVADLVTKGFELTLTYRDKFQVAGKPLNYSARFVLADSRAWITKFDNPEGLLSKYRVGEELGEIWGFETDGYFQTQEEIDFGANHTDVTSYPSTRALQPGDNKFKDLNGDGKITFGKGTHDDPGDRKVIGNSRSRYPFGIDLSADWNGFDFRVFFQGVGKKNYYPSGYAARTFFWGVFAYPWANVTKENYYNSWTPTRRDAYFPRLKSYIAENAGRPGGGAAEVSLTQTRWLQDASYIRLKNLTLGYTIPSSVLKSIGAANFRVFFVGENLWEYTNLYKYLDPENLVGNNYRFRRTYSIGFSLTF